MADQHLSCQSHIIGVAFPVGKVETRYFGFLIFQRLSASWRTWELVQVLGLVHSRKSGQPFIFPPWKLFS